MDTLYKLGHTVTVVVHRSIIGNIPVEQRSDAFTAKRLLGSLVAPIFLGATPKMVVSTDHNHK